MMMLQMIHGKSRFMSMACLVGMSSAGTRHNHEAGTRPVGLRLIEMQSQPDLLRGEAGNHPTLHMNNSAPARYWLPRERRMIHSPRSSAGDSAETQARLDRLDEWAVIVSTTSPGRKYCMFDLDQAILHRDNGCGPTETRNSGSSFVTKKEAEERQAAYESAYLEDYGVKPLTMVVSKLPVGTGREHPDDNASTWLLVIFRPGISGIFKHCMDNGWTIGVNTAMNPVHGQPIVEGLAKKFNITIKQEHRFFRMSTVRNPECGPKYGTKNKKYYDTPTWLVRLHFNRTESKWYYQYQNRDDHWMNLDLIDEALKLFCPDVVNKGVAPMQDNMLPTYLSDELQRLINPKNAQMYEGIMMESGNQPPEKICTTARTALKNSLHAAVTGIWDLLDGLRITKNAPLNEEEMKKFHYPYVRDPNVPIWENRIDVEEFPTIQERLDLGKHACIVHFDDKDFDVRLDDHDKKGNCGSLPWYPQSCKKDPKKAEKVKTLDEYDDDLEDLKKLLL